VVLADRDAAVFFSTALCLFPARGKSHLSIIDRLLAILDRVFAMFESHHNSKVRLVPAADDY
jgi:hypothetical protein